MNMGKIFRKFTFSPPEVLVLVRYNARTSNKLKQNNEQEVQLKSIMIEGLLSIQAGENPRVIEEKLKSFLAPGSRELMNDSEGGE